jgi:NADPH:quinone reductase-like Zn-dependent oxidoreductase
LRLVHVDASIRRWVLAEARTAEVPGWGYHAVADPKDLALLNRAVDRGHVRVPIAARYPLAQAARAHRRLAEGGILGRLVLRVQC